MKTLNKFIPPPVVAKWKYTYICVCDVALEPLPRLQSAGLLLFPGSGPVITGTAGEWQHQLYMGNDTQ